MEANAGERGWSRSISSECTAGLWHGLHRWLSRSARCLRAPRPAPSSCSALGPLTCLAPSSYPQRPVYEILTSCPSSPAPSVGSTFVRAPPGASLEGEGGRKEGRCEEAVSRAQNDLGGKGTDFLAASAPVPGSCPGILSQEWPPPRLPGVPWAASALLQRSGRLFWARMGGDSSGGPKEF